MEESEKENTKIKEQKNEKVMIVIDLVFSRGWYQKVCITHHYPRAGLG